MGGAESAAWRRNSYMSQMLVLLALATPTVAYYDGPRGYCSPFTARYLGEKVSLPVARPARLRVAEARGENDVVRPARGGRHLQPKPGLLQQTYHAPRGRRRDAVGGVSLLIRASGM